MIRTAVFAISMIASGGYQQKVVLNFADGSAEVCPSSGFVFDGGTLTVNVSACANDVIFNNGFENS